MSVIMTSKRKRPSGDGDQGSGGDHSYLNKKAKRNVIQLIRKTLGSRLESKIITDIVTGLETRFDLTNSAVSDAVEVERDGAASPQSSADGHDESCYSCGTGGELLCCDTCSAVFHLHCLWPKLTAIPKGAWSCPFCVAQGKAKGDVTAAEQAVRKINHISRGILTSASARADAVVSHLDDGALTVQKSAGRFIVRENENNQAVEIGRCYNLHDALEAAHALSNGQKYQFSAVLSHEVQVNSPQYESQSSSVNDKLSLRCTYCMDNKTVLLCAFCGCNTCFEKVNAKSMCMCDDCGVRWHPRCCPEQLSGGSRPDGAWYCGACSEAHPSPTFTSPDSGNLSSSEVAESIGINVSDSASKKNVRKKKSPGCVEAPIALENAVPASAEHCMRVDVAKANTAPSPKVTFSEVKFENGGESEPKHSGDEALINISEICKIFTGTTDQVLSKQEHAVIDCYRSWAPLKELRRVKDMLVSLKQGSSHVGSTISAPELGSIAMEVDEGNVLGIHSSIKDIADESVSSLARPSGRLMSEVEKPKSSVLPAGSDGGEIFE